MNLREKWSIALSLDFFINCSNYILGHKNLIIHYNGVIYDNMERLQFMVVSVIYEIFSAINLLDVTSSKLQNPWSGLEWLTSFNDSIVQRYRYLYSPLTNVEQNSHGDHKFWLTFYYKYSLCSRVFHVWPELGEHKLNFFYWSELVT